MAKVLIECAQSEQLRKHLAILSQLHTLLGLPSTDNVIVSTVYRKNPVDTISVKITLTKTERSSPHRDHFVEQLEAYIRVLRPQLTIEIMVVEHIPIRKDRKQRR